MGRILRELNSIPGMVLSVTITLVIVFWVLNLVHTNRFVPGPVQNAAGWAGSHASGSAYGF